MPCRAPPPWGSEMVDPGLLDLPPTVCSPARIGWGLCRIGDDEQNVVDHVVGNPVAHNLGVGERERPCAERALADHRHPGRRIAAPRADQAVDAHGAPANRRGAGTFGEFERAHRDLERRAVGSGEVEHDLLDADVVDVGWEVARRGGELHRHRCRALIRIVQIVPLIGEIVLEAVGAFCARLIVELVQDLGAIVGTVERRVVNRYQYVGERRVVERVCGLGHAELPLRLDTEFLEMAPADLAANRARTHQWHLLETTARSIADRAGPRSSGTAPGR